MRELRTELVPVAVVPDDEFIHAVRPADPQQEVAFSVRVLAHSDNVDFKAAKAQTVGGAPVTHERLGWEELRVGPWQRAIVHLLRAIVGAAWAHTQHCGDVAGGPLFDELHDR